jgi:hypothetical protein
VWAAWVNAAESPEELAAVRLSVARRRPFGRPGSMDRIAAKLGLPSTLRPRGRAPERPRKGS